MVEYVFTVIRDTNVDAQYDDTTETSTSSVGGAVVETDFSEDNSDYGARSPEAPPPRPGIFFFHSGVSVLVM
jgi:hypothetical protein